MLQQLKILEKNSTSTELSGSTCEKNSTNIIWSSSTDCVFWKSRQLLSLTDDADSYDAYGKKISW